MVVRQKSPVLGSDCEQVVHWGLGGDPQHLPWPRPTDARCSTPSREPYPQGVQKEMGMNTNLLNYFVAGHRAIAGHRAVILLQVLGTSSCRGGASEIFIWHYFFCSRWHTRANLAPSSRHGPGPQGEGDIWRWLEPRGPAPGLQQRHCPHSHQFVHFDCKGGTWPRHWPIHREDWWRIGDDGGRRQEAWVVLIV